MGTCQSVSAASNKVLSSIEDVQAKLTVGNHEQRVSAAILVDSYNSGVLHEANNPSKVVQQAMNELIQLTPQEQYQVVYQQVEMQFGWIFEETPEDDTSLVSGDPNIDIINSNNNESTCNESSVSVVTYVSNELNKLIEKSKKKKKSIFGKSRKLFSKRKNNQSTDVPTQSDDGNQSLEMGSPELKSLHTKTQFNLTQLGFRNVDCTIEKSVLTSDAHRRIRKQNLVLIESGALVGDINEYYWPRDKHGSLKDKNDESYHVLANGCGCNDSECNVSAIKSCIESIELVTVKDDEVIAYQVEPENGIHDSQWGVQVLESQGVQLIQDNQAFNDVLMNMYNGCYGVVTRIYVRMENAYYLTPYSEKVLLKNWEKRFDEIVKCINTNGEVEDWQIFGNPYKISDCCDENTSIVFLWWAKKDQQPQENEQDRERTSGIHDEKKDDNLIVRLNSKEMKMVRYTTQILVCAGMINAVSAGLDLMLNQRLIADDSDCYTIPCIKKIFNFDLKTDNKTQFNENGYIFTLQLSETKKIVNGYVDFLHEQARSDSKLMITSTFTVQFNHNFGKNESVTIEHPSLIVGKEHKLSKRGFKTSLKNENKLLNESKKWFDKNIDICCDDKEIARDYSWWQNITFPQGRSFVKDYSKFDNDDIFKSEFVFAIDMGKRVR